MILKSTDPTEVSKYKMNFLKKGTRKDFASIYFSNLDCRWNKSPGPHSQADLCRMGFLGTKEPHDRYPYLLSYQIGIAFLAS